LAAKLAFPAIQAHKKHFQFHYEFKVEFEFLLAHGSLFFTSHHLAFGLTQMGFDFLSTSFRYTKKNRILVLYVILSQLFILGEIF